MLYVDDLLIIGNHQLDSTIAEIRKIIHMDDPTPIDKYLGCRHYFVHGQSTATCTFDMRDYLRAAVKDFVATTGIDPKPAATPYAPDLPREQADKLLGQPGVLGPQAAHFLMKVMYAARMASPNLSVAIQRLATQVTRWNADCDRRLTRLFGYIKDNPQLTLKGTVAKEFNLDDVRIIAWPDADLAGDTTTSRSTSGYFLEVATSEQHMFPISWGCKKQTSTSTHTCEAETVSLATCVKDSVYPVQNILSRMLSRPIPVQVMEDNTATITAIRKGYSPALRHLSRTQRVDLGFLHECFEWHDDEEDGPTNPWRIILLKAPTSSHKGDMFTKPLTQVPFKRALEYINMTPELGFIT